MTYEYTVGWHSGGQITGIHEQEDRKKEDIKQQDREQEDREQDDMEQEDGNKRTGIRTNHRNT